MIWEAAWLRTPGPGRMADVAMRCGMSATGGVVSPASSEPHRDSADLEPFRGPESGRSVARPVLEGDLWRRPPTPAERRLG